VFQIILNLFVVAFFIFAVSYVIQGSTKNDKTVEVPKPEHTVRIELHKAKWGTAFI